jgi:hypothetical protein
MADSMRFMPRNPQKYAGDPLRIVARSKWELMYMQALDNSNIVTKWVSEPRNLGIKYISPIDKKLHEYWPDFLVQYNSGELELIEIKPLKEALMSEARSTYDKLMLVKNIAKWQAADRMAKSIGARFRVVTERDLFKKKTTRKPVRSKSTVKPRGTRGTK